MASLNKYRQASTNCDTIPYMSPLTPGDFKQKNSFGGGSTRTASGYHKCVESSYKTLSSTIELAKDLDFETYRQSHPDSINFNWLANKCSNFGFIDGVKEFHELFSGKINEDYCAVLLTLNTLQEVNEKFRSLFKNQTSVTQNYFKTVDQFMPTEDSSMDKNELKKIIMLSTINSDMEQTNKILLLVYLLKQSIRERDCEDFITVVEHLYYLSHLRRFNDGFVTVLEEITLFGCSEDDTDECEINNLFILNTDFFEEDLTIKAKIYYLSFLCNLSRNARISF